MVRVKQRRIDATGPTQDVVKTMAAQLVCKRGRRDHGAAPGVVKPAHPRPSPVWRDWPARRKVIGKAGVQARGVGETVSEAKAADEKTDLAFRFDVDGIGTEHPAWPPEFPS